MSMIYVIAMSERIDEYTHNVISDNYSLSKREIVKMYNNLFM